MSTAKHIGGKLLHAYANRDEPENVRILAHAYWHMLLLTTTLIVIAVVAYGLWQLMALTEEPEPALVPSAPASILDRSQLEGTVEGLTERRGRYDFLKDNPPRISDPSR